MSISGFASLGVVSSGIGGSLGTPDFFDILLRYSSNMSSAMLNSQI